MPARGDEDHDPPPTDHIRGGGRFAVFHRRDRRFALGVCELAGDELGVIVADPAHPLEAGPVGSLDLERARDLQTALGRWLEHRP